MPAFMAAVAASECGEARDADGDWFLELALGEGGSELMSGAIVDVSRRPQAEEGGAA